MVAYPVSGAPSAEPWAPTASAVDDTRSTRLAWKAPRRRPDRQEEAHPTAAAGSRRLLRVGKWALIVGLVCSVLAVGSFVFLYQSIEVPDPNEDFQTQTSFVYYADGKTELGRYATQNRESISLEEMPENIQDAVVAAENRSFWTDSGIDPKGIVRAAFSNARGNATQGASTITQQYVKILYLTQERSLTRKAKEAILSLKLQRQQSKKEILEGYLNTIYFGRGAYGIQAASKAYFDNHAKDLNLKQSAVLASVLNNPTGYDPANGKTAKENLHERYDYVLRSMVATGAIDRRGGRAGRAEAAAVPEDRGGVDVRRPEGPHAQARQGRAAPARLQGRGDRRPGPAGHHDLHPEGDGRRRGGRARGAAGGLQGQEAAHRGRHRRAGHRRPARLLRRSGLPRLADQLGGLRRHGRLHVQAVHPRRRAQATATRSRTPSTATRPTSSRTAGRSGTRAPAPTGSATTTARP